MLLKDYIPYVPKRFYHINFSGIAFDSLKVKKNDIFFAIKGKNNDGNKFVKQAFKNKASIAVVNKTNKNFKTNRQIKVKDTLKFFSDTSKIFRKNINTRIVAITGSCGKTTLKELLGNTLKKISKVEEVDFVGKLSPVYQLIKLVSSSQFTNNKTTIGFVGAPWTLLVYTINKKSPKLDLNDNFFENKLLIFSKR